MSRAVPRRWGRLVLAGAVGLLSAACLGGCGSTLGIVGGVADLTIGAASLAGDGTVAATDAVFGSGESETGE